MPTRSKSKSKPGPRARDAESTRHAILDAAQAEIAQEGIAGARTDAIARAAGVNKALLYYYFKDKEELHGAVLDRAFSGLVKNVWPALDAAGSPKERILAYVGAHFDHVASNPAYAKLVQQEMTRAGRTGSPHLSRLVGDYFKPTYQRIATLLDDGIRAGDFRPVDAFHFTLSTVASIVFYFCNLPALETLIGTDPLNPEIIAARRRAVQDYVAAALFVHHESRRKK